MHRHEWLLCASKRSMHPNLAQSGRWGRPGGRAKWKEPESLRLDEAGAGAKVDSQLDGLNRSHPPQSFGL